MEENVKRFFAAWGETDNEAQKGAIADVLDAGCTYSDPRTGGILEGVDATAEYVAMFAANAPGWQAAVTGFDVVNGYFRAIVTFSGAGPDGTEISQIGTYFGEANDANKLIYLAGFVGTGA